MNSHSDTLDLRGRIVAFFTSYRIPLIVAVAVIIVGLVAFFVGSQIVETRLQSSLEMIEGIQDDYQAWADLDPETEEAAAQAEDILAAIDETVRRYPRSYAAQRARFVGGSIHFDRGDFQAAAESFREVADRFDESHLAPLALATAASAMEEADDAESAAEFWRRIVDDYGTESSESARALFSLGRIAEAGGSFEEAAVRYNRLLDDFPSSSWTSLARNRIIYLTTEGLIGS